MQFQMIKQQINKKLLFTHLKCESIPVDEFTRVVSERVPSHLTLNLASSFVGKHLRVTLDLVNVLISSNSVILELVFVSGSLLIDLVPSILFLHCLQIEANAAGL